MTILLISRLAAEPRPKHMPRLVDAFLIQFLLQLSLVREVIPRKNMLRFGHCPKGGGVQPESKLFEALFFRLDLDIFQGGGGGQGDFDNVQIEADFFTG